MYHDPKTVAILDGLKSKLAEILKEFDTSSRIVYIDYPVHLNIGDLLINQGAEQLFHENSLDIWKRYYVLDIPQQIRGIDDSVVFLLHGGGNFGDIWAKHQQMREALLRRYPKNRFVFLPQTIFFKNKELERKCLIEIAQHKNCKIFGRDDRSTEILHRGGISGASSMPDMAHMLWKVIQPSMEATASTTLRLIRDDREARGTFGAELITESAPNVDWAQVIRRNNLLAANITYRFMHLLVRLKMPVQKSHLWYPIRDLAVNDGIQALSQHASVVTDRLHAMILALLLGRHVTISDNSYGKLSGYADTWLKGMPLLTSISNTVV